MGSVVAAEIWDKAVDVAGAGAAVREASCGAEAIFHGVVRNHDEGRAVTRLEYSAHPQAQEFLAEVAQEIAQRPGIVKVYAIHRVGALEVGDTALVLAVSAAHRGEAFAALAWGVDEIKARVPIWKHQFYPDGSDDWSNCP